MPHGISQTASLDEPFMTFVPSRGTTRMATSRRVVVDAPFEACVIVDEEVEILKEQLANVVPHLRWGDFRMLESQR
jgi:hypothetical protein